MIKDGNHNYIIVSWYDYLAMPIALCWFIGLVWIVCMAIVQIRDAVPVVVLRPFHGGAPCAIAAITVDHQDANRSVNRSLCQSIDQLLSAQRENYMDAGVSALATILREKVAEGMMSTRDGGVQTTILQFSILHQKRSARG